MTIEDRVRLNALHSSTQPDVRFLLGIIADYKAEVYQLREALRAAGSMTDEQRDYLLAIIRGER